MDHVYITTVYSYVYILTCDDMHACISVSLCHCSISLWRIIDAIVMGISAVVVLIAGAVLHDGMNKTCAATTAPG